MWLSLLAQLAAADLVALPVTQSAAALPAWVSPLIAVAALAVSIVALVANRSDKRRELHLAAILKAMQDLEATCARFAVEVEENLLFKCHPAGTDHSDCHRQATLMSREAAAQLDLVEKLVPTAAEQLFHGFKQWHTALTECNYPIQRIEDALRVGDARINDVRKAQRAWNSLLCDIRVGCLSRRLKYWKNLGKKIAAA